MAAPDIYSVSNGRSIFGGRARPADRFKSFAVDFVGSGAPDGTETIPILELHGSGGQNTTTGKQYLANVGLRMGYQDQNLLRFSLVKVADPTMVKIRPNDLYGHYANAALKESMWLGFQHAPTNYIALITERRLNALLTWSKENMGASPNWNKLSVTGGSMGGWGTLSYGIRRSNIFAALYPDRPRWRYSSIIGDIEVADWTGVLDNVAVSSAPNIHPEDASGSVAVRHDIITYASNTANPIPWIGWNVGRQDPYVQFSDHVDAVVALRAAKRGFAFAWNNGDHTTGSIPTQITQSYNYGLFELGKGYPLFTNHSLDQDPAIDLVGGINIGLTFRNVVESSGAWSCDVTNILNPCTVDVVPISPIYTGTPTPQHVTIPAANTWVTVTF